MPILFNKNTANLLAEQKENTFRNRLFDTEFEIGGKVFDVSFANTKLSPESKIILRHAIVSAFGGYGENGDIAFNINHAKALPMFIAYISSLDVINILEDFTFTEHLGFIPYLLQQTSTAKDTELKNGTYSFQTVVHTIGLLNAFAKNARLGEINWSTTSLITSQKIKEIGCDYLESNTDVDVLEWMYGGSLETVSLPTAMLMLNYALQQLDSLEYHLLSSYFTVCRREGRYTWWITSKGVRSVPVELLSKYGHLNYSEMEEFHESGIPSMLKKNNHIEMINFWFEEYQKRAGSLEDYSKFIEIATTSLQSFAIINSLVDKYYCCALGIISILTGYRVHELTHIKALAIQRKSDTVHLTTRIDKTHQGLPVSRSTGDAVAMAVNVLLDLSFIDKTLPIKYKINGNEGDDYCSLFFQATTISVVSLIHRGGVYQSKLTGAWLSIETQTQKSKNDTLNRKMRRLFDLTIQSLNGELRAEVLALDETITVHAFRHVFVDFILRRFDGDVHRAIRRYLAHSSKDVMQYVENYIRNKVPAHVQQTAERAYAEELIKRVAGDVNHTKFTGSSIDYIRSKLEKMHWTTIDELDELIHEWISSGDDEFIRLVPHSFGYCILFRNREHLARCREKGITKVERGESKMCIGCGNFGANGDCHLTTLNQLQIIHRNILTESSNPKNLMSLVSLRNNKQYQESTRIIRTIDVMQQQLSPKEAKE